MIEFAHRTFSIPHDRMAPGDVSTRLIEDRADAVFEKSLRALESVRTHEWQYLIEGVQPSPSSISLSPTTSSVISPVGRYQDLSAGFHCLSVWDDVDSCVVASIPFVLEDIVRHDSEYGVMSTVLHPITRPLPVLAGAAEQLLALQNAEAHDVHNNNNKRDPHDESPDHQQQDNHNKAPVEEMQAGGHSLVPNLDVVELLYSKYVGAGAALPIVAVHREIVDAFYQSENFLEDYGSLADAAAVPERQQHGSRSMASITPHALHVASKHIQVPVEDGSVTSLNYFHYNHTTAPLHRTLVDLHYGKGSFVLLPPSTLDAAVKSRIAVLKDLQHGIENNHGVPNKPFFEHYLLQRNLVVPQMDGLNSAGAKPQETDPTVEFPHRRRHHNNKDDGDKSAQELKTVDQPTHVEMFLSPFRQKVSFEVFPRADFFAPRDSKELKQHISSLPSSKPCLIRITWNHFVFENLSIERDCVLTFTSTYGAIIRGTVTLHGSGADGVILMTSKGPFSKWAGMIVEPGASLSMRYVMMHDLGSREQGSFKRVSGTGTHIKRLTPALTASPSAKLTVSHCAILNAEGTAFAMGKHSEVVINDTIVQDVAQGGECVSCHVQIHRSHFIDFPYQSSTSLDLFILEGQSDDDARRTPPNQPEQQEQMAVQVPQGPEMVRSMDAQQHQQMHQENSLDHLLRTYIDGDNDAFYFRGGKAMVQDSVFVNALDDCIDSASSKGDPERSSLTLEHVALINCQHEGVAISSSEGTKRRVVVHRSLVAYTQQAIENGHTSSSHRTTVTDTVLFNNQIGIRNGDNYPTLDSLGMVDVKHSLLLFHVLPVLDWVMKDHSKRNADRPGSATDPKFQYECHNPVAQAAGKIQSVTLENTTIVQWHPMNSGADGGAPRQEDPEGGGGLLSRLDTTLRDYLEGREGLAMQAIPLLHRLRSGTVLDVQEHQKEKLYSSFDAEHGVFCGTRHFQVKGHLYYRA